MQLLTCVSNFQVEEPAVIVEPHFMDMLFEQVRVLTDTANCSAGLTDPNRKRNQHFDFETQSAGFCKPRDNPVIDFYTLF
jgi:hypothetical protein